MRISKPLSILPPYYRVITVDLRGHGESTGTQIGFGKYEPADLRQMLDGFIARGVCDQRVSVMGVSYGAAMALHWAAADSRVQNVIAIAPYNQPDEAMVRFVSMMGLHVPSAVVRSGAYSAAYRLNVKWNEFSGEAAMRRIAQPVFLIGGGQDVVSRPEDIRTMRSAAPGNVEVLILPDCVHQIIGFSMEQLLAPITGWLARNGES
jgi:uncharacterized protein